MIRMKGGGSTPTHSTSTVTQNNLPEYARPWFENLLGRTAYESTRPYTPYPGQRMAYFDPYESMAQEGTAQMGMQGAPSQIGSATDITTQVGYQPTSCSYFPELYKIAKLLGQSLKQNPSSANNQKEGHNP